MSHWRQMMDRPTLGAWDFADGPRTGRIKSVRAEKLEGIPGKIAANRKPVITFEDARGVEWERKLVAGVTICSTIESLYGADPKEWIGKLVTLYADTTRAKSGNTVPCVRVKPVVPRTKADKGPDGPVDEAMRQKQIEGASGGANEVLPGNAEPREPGSDDA